MQPLKRAMLKSTHIIGGNKLIKGLIYIVEGKQNKTITNSLRVKGTSKL